MPPSSRACLHRLRFSSRDSLFVATAAGGEGGLGLGGGGGGGGVGGEGSAAGHCNKTSSYISALYKTPATLLVLACFCPFELCVFFFACFVYGFLDPALLR